MSTPSSTSHVDRPREDSELASRSRSTMESKSTLPFTSRNRVKVEAKVKVYVQSCFVEEYEESRDTFLVLAADRDCLARLVERSGGVLERIVEDRAAHVVARLAIVPPCNDDVGRGRTACGDLGDHGAPVGDVVVLAHGAPGERREVDAVDDDLPRLRGARPVAVVADLEPRLADAGAGRPDVGKQLAGLHPAGRRRERVARLV